jgi:hypothetical protein
MKRSRYERGVPSNLAYLAAAAALGNRHANRRFVHIQSDVCDIVHQGRPSMLEALCRQSNTTLDIVHAEDGPPITQRTSGLGASVAAGQRRVLTTLRKMFSSHQVTRLAGIECKEAHPMAASR